LSKADVCPWILARTPRECKPLLSRWHRHRQGTSLSPLSYHSRGRASRHTEGTTAEGRMCRNWSSSFAIARPWLEGARTLEVDQAAHGRSGCFERDQLMGSLLPRQRTRTCNNMNNFAKLHFLSMMNCMLFTLEKGDPLMRSAHAIGGVNEVAFFLFPLMNSSNKIETAHACYASLGLPLSQINFISHLLYLLGQIFTWLSSRWCTLYKS